ncbi:MAG: hypothetical protein U0R52_04495 [Solirubrobacterales bacterium]
MDLDSYAAAAERFLTDLDREYHLHFSGQKPCYQVEAVYARHPGLFDRAAVEEIREAREGSEGEERRQAAYLLEFAVGGYLGRACAPEEEALAGREAELEIVLDGEAIPYRMAPVEQANEPDPARRAEIEQARSELLASELNPLHLGVLERSHALVAELGWPSYAAAYGELRGVDLEALAAQARRFLEATGQAHPELIVPQYRQVLGMEAREVRRSDLARLFRAPDLDAQFPGERLLGAFTETMAGLGLDLGAQPNIVFDTETRPTKSPRAYCAPVRVPDEVYLVVPRVGGREDYAALFHEGGHAEHYANVDPSLPVAYRYLGDNSVTESFAFLIEHIAEEEAWIASVLGTDPAPVLSHARAVRIYFLRRYAAKIVYELELHSGGADLAAMPARYAELMRSASGIPWPQEPWLDDVDGGFYVAAYLRAWALERRWREHLSARFDKLWYRDPSAGAWLEGLWREGQRLRADELLSEQLSEELRFDDLAADFS